MKYTQFKTVALMLSASVLLGLSGCNGNAGTESNSGIGEVPGATVHAAPLAVNDDTNETISHEATTLNVVENDIDTEGDIDVSTVNFTHTDATDADGDNDNDQLIVVGEGNWTVNEDGNVTFSPDASFVGDPTPIFYTVSDNTGLESNEAKITIDYPEFVQSVSLSSLETGYLVSGTGANPENIFDFTSIEFCGNLATYAWVTDFGGDFPPSTIDYIIDVNDIIFGFEVLVETDVSGTPGALSVGTSYFFPGPDVNFTITKIEPVACIPAPIR